MTTTLMPLNFNRFVDSFFAPTACRTAADASPRLAPRADVFEGDKDYIIRLDLPGVNRDDLNIEIENDTLNVSVERKFEAPEGYRSLRSEHAESVTYRRTFELGRHVASDRIQARFADGVLELTLPKSDQALPRRIEVK
jgi:HSP20 family protein